MPLSVPSQSSGLGRYARHAWWILLIAALGAHWFATERRVARVQGLTELPSWSADAPDLDARSPTGLEQGQRSLIVPGHHNPSFWWIMEAQQAAEDGALRLRHIDYDAPADGRDTPRTSLYRWWLIVVGWSCSVLQGAPIGYAIERGALYADPILFDLLLVGGAVYSARYLGRFAGVGFALGGIALFPLSASFQPGAPDSHALSWVLAVGSALPLLAALQRPGQAGWGHCVLAGALGGLGLWNDATSQAPALLGVFVGGLCFEWLRSRTAPARETAGFGWRLWAGAGAATSLAASLFEFAPNKLSWSLDAVNPVHALAWWGMGEVLRVAGLRWSGLRQRLGPRSLGLLALAFGAILAWPVVEFWRNSGSLLASDFYARQLANDPAGGMAPSLGAWLDRASGGSKLATLLPSLLLIILALRSASRDLDAASRGRLCFVLAPALVAAGLALQQLRWWNLFDAFALVAIAALFAEAQRQRTAGAFAAWGASLAALPGLFVGFPAAVPDKPLKALSSIEKQSLVERDFAYWLNQRRGEEPIVLYSTPLFSGGAAYYGGFKVIVSSDEGNAAGYQAAARLAAADTAQEVSVLMDAYRITHVALPLWDAALEQLVRAGTGLGDKELPQAAFVVALRDWDLPPWIRALNYSGAGFPELGGFELRAFARHAEQAPDLALSRLADLFVERGMLWEAESIREALVRYPRSPVALGAIANIDFALRDEDRFAESLEQLVPYLSRRAARSLPVDRRVSLAALLMQAQRKDLARQQIAASMEAVDAETLRLLTPTTVAGLVALSRAFQIPFPSEELREQALQLAPPALRQRLNP